MGKAWAVKAARKHAMKYPDRVNRRTKEYQAKKLNAIPTWNERFIVEEAYELAERRSKAFGFKWHVDHIVPIQSPIVCGLHVHSNLQVIPGADNIRKGNLYWPDMP
jgi:hypothetical protein